MGHYVGLRFNAKLKPEFVDVVALLLEVGQSTVTACWKHVALSTADSRHDFLLPWSEQDRAGQIPFGFPQDMPLDWEARNELDGDVWRVCCATKNEKTLEYFISEVLPRMSLEVPFCETCIEAGHPEHPYAEGIPRTRMADPAWLALADALLQVEQLDGS